MHPRLIPTARGSRLRAIVAGLVAAASPASASDHLDAPTVIANPQADISDLYAWTAPDGARLNLVMTIVGRSFSDRLDYVFHIDSGPRFGRTSETLTIVCRFPSADRAVCRAGEIDVAEGDPTDARGLSGRNGRLRLFAGLRDDPFFNNVLGTRAAYETAQRAIANGSRLDPARCPRFDDGTVASILEQWRRTDGGPGRNFLAGWTAAAIVISIDIAPVTRGGPILAVWAATRDGERQLDRAARPLTGNALLGTLDTEAARNRMKEDFNAATPADGARFAAEIAINLGLYDGFDGQCGNQLLAGPSPSPDRYIALGRLLADDRLWIDSRRTRCTQLFAVELVALARRRSLAGDCGGRTPNYPAVTVYRSLLADATNDSIVDGVARDESEHSEAIFPFLAPPAAGSEAQ